MGRAVYAFIPEVSFSCPLILLRWQLWLTCKASSSTKKKKKKPGEAALLGWELHTRILPDLLHLPSVADLEQPMRPVLQ